MFTNYRKTQWRRSTLSGNTMIELLVVMIVAGIVFLMAFEGAEVFRKYSLLLSRKLTAQTSLLYSHQTLELRVSRYCPWQQSSSMSTKNHSAPVEKEGQVFYSS